MTSVLGAEAARKQIRAALYAVDAAHQVLRSTSSDMVGNDFRADIAERLGPSSPPTVLTRPPSTGGPHTPAGPAVVVVTAS